MGSIHSWLSRHRHSHPLTHFCLYPQVVINRRKTLKYAHSFTRNPITQYRSRNSHQWESYTLGKAPPAPEPGADLTVAEQNALAANLELARGVGSRYLVQRWGDGTLCDKTKKPREVEVQVSRFKKRTQSPCTRHSLFSPLDLINDPKRLILTKQTVNSSSTAQWSCPTRSYSSRKPRRALTSSSLTHPASVANRASNPDATRLNKAPSAAVKSSPRRSRTNNSSPSPKPTTRKKFRGQSLSSPCPSRAPPPRIN